MSETPGIGGGPPPTEPTPPTQPPVGGDKSTDVAHGKGTTTGDLKAFLIESFGDEQGNEFYNQFMKSISMSMLAQVQQASERAKKAAQEMRKAGSD